MDIIAFMPRMAQRVGSFVFLHFPEQVDNIIGRFKEGGGMIAEATAKVMNSSVTSQDTVESLSSSHVTASIASTSSESSMAKGTFFSFRHLASFGGFFAYLTSKWAFATVSLVSFRETYPSEDFLTPPGYSSK